MRKRSVFRSVFVIVRTICIGIWARWVITAIKYNKETDSASFGFDRYWVQGLKCLLVTPINRVLSAHAHAVLTYQTTPTAAFKHTLSLSAKHENDHH